MDFLKQWALKLKLYLYVGVSNIMSYCQEFLDLKNYKIQIQIKIIFLA